MWCLSPVVEVRWHWDIGDALLSLLRLDEERLSASVLLRPYLAPTASQEVLFIQNHFTVQKQLCCCGCVKAVWMDQCTEWRITLGSISGEGTTALLSNPTFNRKQGHLCLEKKIAAPSTCSLFISSMAMGRLLSTLFWLLFQGWGPKQECLHSI